MDIVHRSLSDLCFYFDVSLKLCLIFHFCFSKFAPSFDVEKIHSHLDMFINKQNYSVRDHDASKYTLSSYF